MSPAAAPPWRQHVHIIASPDASVIGSTWVLPDGAELTLGRARDTELSIQDPALSRRHLRVSHVGGLVTLLDLRSRNGTRIGKQRLGVAQELVATEVVVRVGATLLHVGRALDVSGDALDPLDRLHDWAARLASTSAGPLLFETADTDGLLRALARRLVGERPLVVGAPAGPGRSVLLNPTARALQQAVAQSADVVAVVERATEPLSRVVGEAATVALPSLRERRDELVRLTRLALPALRRGSAWATWLGLRIDALSTLEVVASRLATLESPTGRDLRRAWSEAPEPAEPPGPAGRQMWRPTREALSAALERFPTVAAAAAHFGRSRRQVYRWIDELGVVRGRGEELLSPPDE